METAREELKRLRTAQQPPPAPLNARQELEQLRGKAQPPSPIATPTPEPQVPEWGERHPTAYGVAGAVAETGKTIAGAARATGEFLGLEKATEPFAQVAARATVPEELKEAIPEPTTGELVGGGLQIGALFIPYGQLQGALAKGFGGLTSKTIAAALGTAGAGAVGGYAVEAGEKIQKGEAPTPGLTTALGAVAPVAIPLVAKQIAKMKPQKFAERLYESTIRPSTTLKPDARARVLKSALDESIVPTKAGVEKTQKLITKYTNEVDDLIDSGMKKGGGSATIKTDDVLTRLDDVKAYFDDDILGANPIGDIDKIAEKLKSKFPGTMTVRDAQRVKRALQKELKDAFGEHSTAKKEAAKQISRGIREELEKVFPEIGGLNQKSRGLIELNKELERAVGRLSNRNLFGLTTKIFAAAGVGKEAPGLGLILALSESVIGNPRVKSRLAIALSKASGGKASKISQRMKEAFPKAPRFPGDVIAEDVIPIAKKKLSKQ